MPLAGSSDAAFTSARARDIFVQACTSLGLPSGDAELLRLGENAIFRVRGHQRQLVVRISRSLTRMPIVERELCVARWLDTAGVPVARPFDDLVQPVVVGGHPVSVWHFVDTGMDRPGVGDLARLLRQVHAVQDGPCDLPQLDPLVHVESRIRGADRLESADRDFLLDWSDQLRQRYAGLDFALRPGFIHGDAHTGNLLGTAGRAVLTDFEMVAVGPREWDLAPLAVIHARFGLTDHAYRDFVDEYGFDVESWPGFPVLRDIRELTMTAWLMQNLAEGPAVADEVSLRIASIRDGNTHRAWHAF